MQDFGTATLGDLGELAVIDEVILPLARKFDSVTVVGDDCAFVGVPDGTVLAATADVGPTPLLHTLPGYERDFEAAGWLAVVAAVSDLATAGSHPLFITNCIDAPPDCRISDFINFLTGYFRACAELGFKNGGGDLRQGPKLMARVFAVGTGQGRVGRSGARPGDLLVVVGQTGAFMGNYLLARAAIARDGNVQLPMAVIEALRFPRPKISEMALLAGRNLVSSASDTSDGLLGAIDNLARASGLGFELMWDTSLLPQVVVEAGQVAGLNPWNIFFAWGDWSVAATVPPDALRSFTEIAQSAGVNYTVVGRVVEGSTGITAREEGMPPRQVNVVRNENFTTHGFTGGVQGHLEYMLRTRIL